MTFEEPLRILAIDAGAGTQDILLYESDRTPENCIKLVLPSQTQVVARRIAALTARGVPLHISGRVMGGGASSEAIEAHLEGRAANGGKGPRRNIKLIHQGNGRGKGDAVRKGFAAATGDILFILDADLTVPPEDLPKFYLAIAEGRAEFVNGSRLAYPMEGEAMRLLNTLGNKAFGLALSATLEQRLKDTLCGTKVMYRRDYQRLAENRHFFGDFDPFGDFDLLFGAAKLNLKIVELPIRYRARTYGETKISRFKNGLELLRMTEYAFRKFRSAY